jgi:UrcA family protein
MKNLHHLIATITIGLIGTAAQAAPDLGTLSETVRFADLNIESPQGAAQLYQRIHAAAQDVCHPLDSERSFVLIQKHRVCMQTAIGSAVAQVGVPELTDYAQSRGLVAKGVSIARNQ